MNANIIINGCRVSVESRYDPQLIKFYKSINKYYWDKADFVWTFPVEAMELLTSKLREQNYEITVVDGSPRGRIWIQGDECKVELNAYFENFEALRALSGYHYDNETRTCTFKSSEIAAVETIFKESKYPYDRE